jgi:acyl carrier protein
MDKVYDILYSSLEEINKMRPFMQKIHTRPDICLYGSKSIIDSLEFINLMVTIEQKIEHYFKLKINLTGPELRNAGTNPFETIETLHAYITSLLEKQSSL